MEANNQALVHLLSLVGSHFLEAEGSGMVTAGGEEHDLDHDDGSSDSEPVASTSRLAASTSALQRTEHRTVRLTQSQTLSRPREKDELRRRIMTGTGEEHDTPKESSTPLGASTLGRAVHPDSRSIPDEHESDSSASSASGMAELQVSIHALSMHALPQDQEDESSSSSSHEDGLAERLHTIFDLDEAEQLLSCHSCWLFRGILLQGYLYLFTSHLCFYAYLPSRQEHILKAGMLKKRTRRTLRFSKHWAVLRGRSLSWYESETDPFFPQDHIDLRNVLDVSTSEADGHFSVQTPYRTFTFDAGSKDSCEAWIATLRRAVFRAANEGESVRICIPYETIITVDKNTSGMAGLASASDDAQNMINVKVLQTVPGDADCQMDEYVFAHVQESDRLEATLHDNTTQKPKMTRAGSIRDSTQGHPAIAIPRARQSPKMSSDASLASELADASSSTFDDYALSTSARTLKTSELIGYPPMPSQSATAQGKRVSLDMQKPGPISSLLKSTSRLTAQTSALTERLPRRLVQERWSQRRRTNTSSSMGRSSSRSSTSAQSISEGSNFSELEDARDIDPVEQAALNDFHSTFSLPDEEELVGHIKASLYRVLPVNGRVYISTNYLCFRSSRFTSQAMGRTMMVLPRSEIISCARNCAFQYGAHGLVVIVRGHEELFLEFASIERRDQCLALLEYKAATSRRRRDDHLILTDFDEQRNTASPAVSRSSLALSSFLSSQPRANMHFTFLTVGSRGDVQPYIALAQGLKKEGHRVRIATHPEFQSWIEGYGVEFCGIGGDPAELMRICVDNGTFTVAFLREGVTRFRGWLDDLLVSSWHACQGTDVVIESPSAIAGIHIAEALGVPYFRAFTMPWSRTRAYPHAFAVPSRRAGGNYNYMSYVIFDQVFWRASAGQINSWRKKVLNLPATNIDRLEAHKVPFLYNFSPSLVPKPLDWYDWIHVTGYWFLEEGQTSAPEQGLVDFIARTRETGKKLAYIGWGSIVVADADAVLFTVLEAVRRSGVSAIISRGWSDRLSDKPRQDIERQAIEDGIVYMVESVPHGWLFPQVDVACHHGGSGTLGASLRAGVPTIVRPYFGDQFFWASQVESLQVGRRLAQPLAADDFAEALRTCTTDVRMRENAKALGNEIASENGVAQAIRAIYADWDYACSRIVPRGPDLPTSQDIPPADSDARSTHSDAHSDDGWSVVSESEGV